MKLIDELKLLTDKINSLHINDPAIVKYWDEISAILVKDQNETIQFLDSLEDPDMIEDLSSVFDDVSREFQSAEFIDCIERLDRRYPQLHLTAMVNAAKSMIVGN